MKLLRSVSGTSSRDLRGMQPVQEGQAGPRERDLLFCGGLIQYTPTRRLHVVINARQ